MFIQLSPTVEETREYERKYGGNRPDMYLALQRYRLKHFPPNSVGDLVKLTAVVKPRNDFVFNKLNQEKLVFIRENLHMFLGWSPSTADLCMVSVRYANRKENTPLIFQLLTHALEMKLPKTAEEFLQVVKHFHLEMDSSRENYDQECELIARHLPYFFDLKPTVKQVNQLAAGTNPSASSLHIALKEYIFQLDPPQTTAEFFEYTRSTNVNNGYFPQQEFATYLADKVYQNIDVFKGLNPTEREIQCLIEEWLYPRNCICPRNPQLALDLKRHLFKMYPPQTPEEFLVRIRHYQARSGLPHESVYWEGIYRLFEDHLNWYLSFNPSIRQVCDLFDELICTNPTPSKQLEWKRKILEQYPPRNAHQFLQLMAYRSFRITDDYRKERWKLIQDHLEQFLSLNPTVEQSNLLMQDYGYTEDITTHIQLKKHMMNTMPPTSVADYFALLRHSVVPSWSAFPVKEYKEALWREIEENYLDLFFSFRPTAEGVNELLQDWCFGPDQALSFLRVFQRMLNEVPPTTPEQMLKLLDIQRTSDHIAKSQHYTMVEGFMLQHVHQFYHEMQSTDAQKAQMDEVIPNLSIFSQPITRERLVERLMQLEAAAQRKLEVIYADRIKKIDTKKDKISSIELVALLKVLTAKKEQYRNDILRELSQYKTLIRYLKIGSDKRELLTAVNKWEKSFEEILSNAKEELEGLTGDSIQVAGGSNVFHRDELSLIGKPDEVICPDCYIGICPCCGKRAHKGLACKDADKVEIFLTGDRELQKMMDSNIIQKCPQCDSPGIRFDACEHIKCPRCGVKWNYRGEYRINEDKSLNVDAPQQTE